MLLRESIEGINKQLVDEFGAEFGKSPRFRVVFSEDQFEKRWVTHTVDGLELSKPIIMELPKYRQYIQAKYILERLVPVAGETDLVTKVSYEPAWVFQDRNGNYLPPFFEGCKLIVESIYEKMGYKGHAKYKDPNVTKEARLAHIEKVEEELFGNETNLTDDLHNGSAVTVPSNYKTH